MTTLLAIGDIHLGRSPSALHPDLLARAPQLGPEAAWARAVTEAIDRQVDGVLLAGDLVERSRDLLVAYGDLKNGVEKLATAGIPVLAVAGNHDTLVLPRLAREIDALQLLGAEGRWQEKNIGKLNIIGWSFPRPQVRHSPLKELPPISLPERTIGLLHCDRDQSDSPYAPVSSAELEAAPTAAWLLGHIHQPDALVGPRPIGYLGSLNALRASETGARGPWLLRWRHSGLEIEQLPLAPLRYEVLELDLSELDQAEGLAELILSQSRLRAAELVQQGCMAEVVGLRLNLSGRCRFERQLPATVDQLMNESRPWDEHGLVMFVQKINTQTRPDFDLAEVAQRADPCGLLARRLQILADPGHPNHQSLLDQARGRLARVAGLREFQALGVNVDDEVVRRSLQHAGQRALLELLNQQRDVG